MERGEAMQIRVLVVDDHAIVRAGVCALLEAEPDIVVVAQAHDAVSATKFVQETKPDVVIMDLSMPLVSGFETIRRVLDVSPSSRIVVLSMHEDERYFFQALEAGASCYVVKGSPPSELHTAVRAAVTGKAYFCPTVAKQMLQSYLHLADRRSDHDDAFFGLSAREREVLRLIAEGLTSREVAERLFLSPNTIERHRANIMEKLQIHNRAQLVKFAIRHGLVGLES
jgi:two-component system, NarL family, response regulator NreC